MKWFCFFFWFTFLFLIFFHFIKSEYLICKNQINHDTKTKFGNLIIGPYKFLLIHIASLVSAQKIIDSTHCTARLAKAQWPWSLFPLRPTLPIINKHNKSFLSSVARVQQAWKKILCTLIYRIIIIRRHLIVCAKVQYLSQGQCFFPVEGTLLSK